MRFKLFLSSFVAVLCFGGSECDYNFFVSKQYDEDKYYCVTNSSFALTWISEDNETSVSNFIPARPEHKIKFKWNWNVTNSFNENLNEVILDRRWEELKVIKTEPVSNGENLNYVHVLSMPTSRDDFEIPFSVRSDREAHVFLCDGAYPPKANCYWFKLQTWSSSIKKCRKYEIPEKNNYSPREPCRHLLIGIEYPKEPLYLSDKYWSHLKIMKKSNYLYLSQDPFEEKILKWTDNDPLSNITHMIIHNNRDVAFWKIHKTVFIYAENSTKTLLVEIPKKSIINGSFCITMYLSMCKTCKLKLIMKLKKSGLEAEAVYNKSLPWSNIIWIVERLMDEDAVIEIVPIDGYEESFWAIDNIRQCNNNNFTEFRMISTNVNVPCQLMSKNNNTILIFHTNGKSKLDIAANNNNCSNNTLDDFCVACTRIYDKCDSISICFKDDETGKQRGFCSTGYENDTEYVFERNVENSNLLYLLVLLLVVIALLVLIIVLFKWYNKRRHNDISVEEVPSISFKSEFITYENTGTNSNLFSKKVSVKNFPMYVKKSEQNGEFDRQHATVLVNPTRKIYDTTLGCQYFDYIDMEYINGSKITKAYIAGETPQLSQFNDFWKTIWDENVEHMLFFENTENDDAFERYWPENTAVMVCHGISLQLAFTNDCSDYKCRNFILIYGKEVRQVRQIHFPYCGLNPEKYVAFLQQLSKIQLRSISPIFVHSSAGLGGTGFILLCDMSLRMAAEEDAVDILRILQRLNDQNSDLVDDLQLYKLVHLVISQYFTGAKRSQLI